MSTQEVTQTAGTVATTTTGTATTTTGNIITASTTTASTTTPAKTGKKASRIPKDPVKILALSTKVQKSWAENPDITLKYVTQEEFLAKVTQLQKIMDLYASQRTKRTPISAQLKVLDRKMNNEVSYIKGFLQIIYEKDNSLSHLAEFGIEKSPKGYTFPSKRQDRLTSIKLLIAALTEHNINDEKHGLPLWSELKIQYEDLVTLTIDNITNFTKLIGDRDLLIEDLRKILGSIINVVKGNNPDTYDNILRSWGFLREMF